ncbi:MAG: hypothetical protein NVSMB70_11010 [Chamaesiphon sp.]
MAVKTHQKHLLVLEDDQGRNEFTLQNSVYSIGRQSTCDIRLFSHFVSRQHATLVRRTREDGSYYYRILDGDLNGKASANGLLINGRKLHAHDLQDEDEIVFSPQVRAVYYLLNPDAAADESNEEWDITLTSANMSDDTEEINLLDENL